MTWETNRNPNITIQMIPTENVAIGFYILFIGKERKFHLSLL